MNHLKTFFTNSTKLLAESQMESIFYVRIIVVIITRSDLEPTLGEIRCFYY